MLKLAVVVQVQKIYSGIGRFPVYDDTGQAAGAYGDSLGQRTSQPRLVHEIHLTVIELCGRVIDRVISFSLMVPGVRTAFGFVHTTPFANGAVTGRFREAFCGHFCQRRPSRSGVSMT